MFRAMTAAVILALISVPTLAADNGFYIGASVGQAGVKADAVDFCTIADNFDGDDTGFKAIVGFRPLDLFAVEVNYVDLGTAEDNVLGANVEADTKGIDAFGVLFLPIPVVDIFLKAGFISWDQDVSVSGLGSASEDGTDFAYGVGVGLGFGSLGARLEYERFEIEDTDTVDMISLGLTWTFL